MGAVEAFCAVDDEGVVRVCGDGGVFGGEGDVEAADGEVSVLDVQVVGVAHGTVLDDGDADVACDETIRKSCSFTYFFLPSEGSCGGYDLLFVHWLIGWVLVLTRVVFRSFQSMLTSSCKLTKNTYVSLPGPHE